MVWGRKARMSTSTAHFDGAVVGWLLPLAMARHELSIFPNASLSGRKQQTWLSQGCGLVQAGGKTRDILPSQGSAILSQCLPHLGVESDLGFSQKTAAASSLLAGSWEQPLTLKPLNLFSEVVPLCKETSLRPEREDVLGELCSFSTPSKTGGRSGLLYDLQEPSLHFIQTVWIVKEKKSLGDVQNQFVWCKTLCKQK